jgi:hypothetical protein
MKTLSQTSPETLKYLNKIGESGYKAEEEYNNIYNNSELFLYYITFVRILTGTIIACSSIQSGLINNDKKTIGEITISKIKEIIKLTNIPGISLFPSLIEFLLKGNS